MLNSVRRALVDVQSVCSRASTTWTCRGCSHEPRQSHLSVENRESMCGGCGRTIQLTLHLRRGAASTAEHSPQWNAFTMAPPNAEDLLVKQSKRVPTHTWTPTRCSAHTSRGSCRASGRLYGRSQMGRTRRQLRPLLLHVRQCRRWCKPAVSHCRRRRRRHRRYRWHIHRRRPRGRTSRHRRRRSPTSRHRQCRLRGPRRHSHRLQHRIVHRLRAVARRRRA